MRKIVIVFLLMCVCIALVGCSNNNELNSTIENNSNYTDNGILLNENGYKELLKEIQKISQKMLYG